VTRWRIIWRCVGFAAVGIGIGLLLSLAIGTVIAYALYPEATVYAITGRGGASTSDWSRVWQIRVMAAGCGFLAGLMISQTALLIEAVQRRGRSAACEHCGYDFRGHAAAASLPITCPECGKVAAA
jgi:hypothetical protein